MKTDTELMQLALEKWGTESQMDMVIEECAELIDAIQKWRRRRVDSVKVLEEAVDVELCLGQLKLMLDSPQLFQNIRKEKLERLEKLLDTESK
jgi:NTP pyrophosphatase (non-canonical NTP hydrolase)